MKKLTVQETANLFGVSVDRIKQQYAENTKGLKKMLDKAKISGKKVNGYSADQLQVLVTEFENKSI